MLALFQLLLRDFGECGLGVEFDSIWWFSDNLKGFLKKTQREFVSRLGGKPESEIFMRFVHELELLLKRALKPVRQ